MTDRCEGVVSGAVHRLSGFPCSPAGKNRRSATNGTNRAALLLLAILSILLACGSVARAADYAARKAEAEGFYAEKSFAAARAVYASLDPREVPPEETRWVAFRLADTEWRVLLAQPSPDYPRVDAVRKQLQDLADTPLLGMAGAGDAEMGLWNLPGCDPVSAEACESLGDSFRARPWRGSPWSWYGRAMDAWAGATENLDTARERFRCLVRKVASDSGDYPGLSPRIGREQFDRFLSVAETPEDRALAHLSLALACRDGASADWDRVLPEFEATLAVGPAFARRDEALFERARWIEEHGKTVLPPSGGVTYLVPDPETAVKLYREFLQTFREGESRFVPEARKRLSALESKVLKLDVSNVFLPGSLPEAAVETRNVGPVTLALYRLDLLSADFETLTASPDLHAFLLGARESARVKLREWSGEIASPGPYRLSRQAVSLEDARATGAYLLTAAADGLEAKELVLVTDLALAGRTADRCVLFAADARTGEAAPSAEFRLWAVEREGVRWRWASRAGRADADGLASFDGPFGASLAVARCGDRCAFAPLGGWRSSGDGEDEDRVYAFTDRPAYRPGETVHWKFVVRRVKEGVMQPPPSGQKLKYVLKDPNDGPVAEGEAVLNAFGSAWGSLSLKPDAPLGAYRVAFEEPEDWDLDEDDFNLFRVEEYRLPEFAVRVRVPEAGGRPRVFRPGETVSVEVAASYLHGAPAADAEVAVTVYARPFQPKAPRGVEVGSAFGRGDAGPGSGLPEPRTFTGRTDASGTYRFTFPAPPDPGDVEFAVSTRVTDLARREGTGEGAVRVSNRPGWVFPEAERKVARPGETVPVRLAAVDANGSPVSVSGKVVVERAVWSEVWADPAGKRYAGEALEAARRAGPSFPPVPAPGGAVWTRVEAAYAFTEVLRSEVAVGADGRGAWSFTAPAAGFYRIRWVGIDPRAMPGSAEDAVWVSDGGAVPGYPVSSVQVLLERKAYRWGETGRALVLAPDAVKAALATVETDRIGHAVVVKPGAGGVFLEWPVRAERAATAAVNLAWIVDGRVDAAQADYTVTPPSRALRVKVGYPKAVFRPGGKATLDLAVTDAEGAPAVAELSLAVVDDAIFAFEPDGAGDPAERFDPPRAAAGAHALHSFGWKPYARVVPPPPPLPGDPVYTTAGGSLGQLVGTVTDASGVVIPGTSVSLVGPGLKRETASDDEGKFRFVALPPGRYDLRADLQGFNSDRIRGLVIRPGEIASVRLRMLCGEISEVVSVCSQAPLYDVTSTTVGVSLIDGIALSGVDARKDFRTTAFWAPAVVTGADGRARVTVTFPEKLTAWRAVARGITVDNRFGMDREAVARTRKPLAVRLQAPRFLVAGDTATVSALVDNLSDGPLDVSAALFADGKAVPGGRAATADGERLSVPAGTTIRVDWTVSARRAGELKLKAAALAGSDADAEEKGVPVYEHGLVKLLATSGTLGAESLELALDLPAARKPGTTVFTVRAAPSLAGVLLDALPYLVDYPYGCTEQTLSRFLPAVVVARALKDLGVPEETVRRRLDDVAAGSAGAADLETPRTTGPGAADPARADHLGKLDDVVRKGLERLADFQHADGGWGWWKDDDSNPYLSAYAVWGLALARQAGAPVDLSGLRNGLAFVERKLVEAGEDFELQAWMLHAAAATRAVLAEEGRPAKPGAAAPAAPAEEKGATKPGAATGANPDDFAARAFEDLWAVRDRLSSFSRALLLLAARDLDRADRVPVLARNLEDGARRGASFSLRASDPCAGGETGADPAAGQTRTDTPSPSPSAPETASWGKPSGYFHWSDGAVESTAFALRALLAADPKHPLAAPAMTWLVRNRRGARWTNTRDTALAVLGLTDWLRATKELASELSYEVQVNGRPLAKRTVARGEAPFAALRLEVPSEALRDGPNRVRVVRTGGDGPLYVGAEASFFSLEEPVTPAANHVAVERRYYRQVTRKTLFKGDIKGWEPLADGATLASGDRVLAVITLEASNDLEFLCVEDLKPAGLEALETKSGDGARALEVSADGKHYRGRQEYAYRELRDRKVALFLSRLPQGTWELRTTYRAEVPGAFHALPAVAHAMYVPEIRGNGAETRLSVTDR
ncbi:MAG: carboxypeptidase regulatory-like domain-containing protein [Acidobacteria bacterium]|nr:carboxypeptidase regulatory-like domain-containing protein [Acidobacteriota bacterium]